MEGSSIATHNSYPSYFLMVNLARHILPAENQTFDIVECATDIDEELHEVQIAVRALGEIGALEYTQKENSVTVMHKRSEYVTPGDYRKIFPNAEPVNPG